MTLPLQSSLRDRMFRGLLVCLFVSGGSGLIYEIAWVRSLELVFGATSFAVATVLAAFMGGLALGSWLMGMAADRLERFHPLRIYAVIECLIGVAGLLVPMALHALVPLYQSIWIHFHSSFAVFGLWRLVLCGAVLLVPTALMGATLPVASRLAAGDPGSDGGAGIPRATGAGRRVGLLYACNTLGALVGCAAAGLALLPAIGLRRTEWVAVGLNLLAAAWALLLARRTGTRSIAEHVERETRTTAEPGVVGRTASVLITLYAVSGAVAMVYEVAWSRLLVLVLGSSTYSYTIMLTTFLAGLAIGAWLGARLVKDQADPLPVAALCQVHVALTTYAGLFFLRELPFLYVVAYDRLRPSPRGLLGVQLALACGLMILPTLGLGAMFPITIGGLRPAGVRAPRVVGWAYAWNTLGAILGSVVAGFVLVPRWGSREALLLGVAASALLGLAGFALARSVPRRRLRFLLAVSVVAFLINLIVAAPALPPEVLSSGVFRYADRYSGLDRRTFSELARATHGEILMFKEGLTCTVTVFRTTTARTLLVNGKPDASVPPGLVEPFVRRSPARIGDLPTQVLLAHIPLVLAPRTDRLLVIGLGSGVTLGSVLTHPVQRVECVELEDAVVRASRFFDDQSGAPLRDPRARLVVNDARNHLLVTGEPYDVIISEPSNPWVAGAAGLFTKDFFELARSRLARGGLFCQWLQLYEMTADDFRAILRSFTAVFPEVQVFRAASDAILVASNGGAPVGLDPFLAGVSGRAAADLDRVGIRGPRDLLAHHWIGGAELRAALSPGPLNTDDNMLIEFTAPLRMLARRPGDQMAQATELAGMFAGQTSGILPHLTPPGAGRPALSRFWAQMSGSTLAGGFPDLAVVYAGHSLQMERNPEAARIYGESLARGGQPAAARPWLEAAAREFPHNAALLRSLVALERADLDWPSVRRHARALEKLEPGDRQALYWAGESLFRLGEPGAANAALTSLVAVAGDSARGCGAAADRGPLAYDEFPDLGYLLGSLRAAAGDNTAAIEPLRRFLRDHPADREARALLADALERAGRAGEALAERRRLSADAPQQAAERLARAEAAWESDPRDRTQALLVEAHEYDPDNDAVTFLLARSFARLRDRPRAIALLEDALDSHPDHPWAIGYLGQLDAEGGNEPRARLLAQRYVALAGRAWETIVDR